MSDWLAGVFAVFPTPMAPDGAVDFASLERMVDFYLEHGSHGLVAVSIIGEGHLMNEAERREVIARVVARTAGRVPVLCGALAESHQEAGAFGARAAEQGVRGLLVKPPRGGRATFDPSIPGGTLAVRSDVRNVVAHYAGVGELSKLPLVVLDYPSAGQTLPVEMLAALCEAVPLVQGIKLEEEPTPPKLRAVRARLGERLKIFGGLGASHALEELEASADGFFTGYPFPEHLVQIYERFKAGDFEKAIELFELTVPMIVHERRSTTNIAFRKEVLRRRGIIADAAVRSPTPPVDAAIRDQVDQLITRMREAGVAI
jgi:4-hydroxy-tetrahydrodipicolinate synthase